MQKASLITFLGRSGVFIALAALILFGWLRYEHFLGLFNISTVLRYNSMFALVALGMCFVIMTGGIDLSVGSTAALGSVAAALLSPKGLWPGTLAGISAGLAVGALNGVLVTRLRILPFIATLATMLAASGSALLLAANQSVSVSYESGFTELGQGDFLNLPIPAIIAVVAYLIGRVILNDTSTGRSALAVGGNEDTSKLMGLPADRVKFLVYFASFGLRPGACKRACARMSARRPS